MTHLPHELHRAATGAKLARTIVICAALMLALGLIMPGEW